MNAVLAVINLVLFVNVHRLLHPQAESKANLLTGLCVVASPLHFFFSNLFYTDILSITLLLSCHALARKYHVLWCSLMGAGAVMIRQTNIVWVCFILFDLIVFDLRLQGLKGSGPPGSLYFEIRKFLQKLVYESKYLLRRFWVVPILPVSFICFVVANGGIVVGDRKAHTSVVHSAQLGYFSLFVFGSMAPILLEYRTLHGVYNLVRTRLVGSVVFFIACGSILYWGTFVHPYILADNRHFTFYIWKRYLSKEWIRLSLTPVVTFSYLSIFHILSKNRSVLWLTAYCTCLAATLVPSGLLEFRWAGILFLIIVRPAYCSPFTMWL